MRESKYTVGQKVKFELPWFFGNDKITGTVADVGVFDAYKITLDTPLHFTIDSEDEEFDEFLLREDQLESL